MLVEIALALITSILLWFVIDQIRFRGYPPGPLRLPLLGNLVQLGIQTLLSESKTPSCVLHKLSKAYGRDVMHVRMGVVDFAVFSSYESITDLLRREGVGNRKSFQYYEDRNDNRNVGILVSNGPTWHTIRHFTIRTLRTFGFGKSAEMDSVVSEEAHKFVRYLTEEAKRQTAAIQRPPQSNAMLLHMKGDLFDLTVVNVLWRLVTGKSYELGDERILEMIRLSNEYVRSLRVDDVSVCYPMLSRLFPGWCGRKTQVECVRRLKDFLNGVVEDVVVSGDIDNFIGVFVRKGEREGGVFDHTQLIYTLLDLFQAGSETTSKTLAFSILHMTRNPDVQESVHKELDGICTNGMSLNELKEALPQSHSVLLETLRFSDVVPVPGPYECFEDLELGGGVRVRKGTPLLCNLEAIHYDDRTWTDPYNYRPERFIVNGHVNAELAEYVVPFGKGKRACLGQTLAETTLFRYFITVFKHFRFEKVGDGLPSAVPIPGLTYTPVEFDVKVYAREEVM